MVEKDAVSKDFRKQILRYELTTAEIVYRRPDRHWLLQTYVWQDYDMFPNFPALQDFLAFWETKLEGPVWWHTILAFVSRCAGDHIRRQSEGLVKRALPYCYARMLGISSGLVVELTGRTEFCKVVEWPTAMEQASWFSPPKSRYRAGSTPVNP